MAHRIRSGTVWINCHNVFDSALPFGGYKQSGWGREMGIEVFNNYTEVKAITTALRSHERRAHHRARPKMSGYGRESGLRDAARL